MGRITARPLFGIGTALLAGLLLGPSVHGQGGGDPLPVTVGVQAGPTPNPARLNESVSATLTASVTPPGPIYGCNLQGPNWSWALAAVSYSADGTTWVTPPPDWYSASLSGNGASATLQASFTHAGSWQLTVSARVTYADDCGDSWMGIQSLPLPVIRVSPPGLSFVSAQSAICAGGKSTPIHQALITATESNPDGSPVVGAPLSFVTSDGTLDTSSAVTDSSGRATVTLTSSSRASNPDSQPPYVYTATVTAIPSGTLSPASTDVEFQPTAVQVYVAPVNIGSGETATFQASLTWGGTPVAQHTVNWRISRIWDPSGNLVYNGSGGPPPQYGTLQVTNGTTDANGDSLATFQAGGTAGTVECEAADQDVAKQPSGETPKAAKAVNAGEERATIVPDDNQRGVNGDLVPSNRARGEKHYVSPYVADLEAFVVLKATVDPGVNFADVFEWDGGLEVAGAADKRKVARSATGKTVVRVKRKTGGAVVDTMNVWIVWANFEDAVAVSTVDSGTTVGTPPGRARDTWRYPNKTVFRFVADIQPAQIITDADRPALDGPKTRPLGGPARFEPGADKRWDVSRRTRTKILNPAPTTIVRNDYWGYDEHEMGLTANAANFPGASVTIVDFPASDIEGNDDKSTGDEDNNPYSAAEGLPDNPGFRARVGQLASTDDPTSPFIRLAAGRQNETVEVRFQFGEFVRLQIGDSGAVGYKNWYRISYYYGWQKVIRYKRDATEMKDNGSEQLTGNDGW
jgi:hypothetical protein